MNIGEWVICLIIVVILMVLVCCPFMGARYESKIYNEKFGTEYTVWDFYWANQAIKKIHEEKIPQRPYELNANLKLGD